MPANAAINQSLSSLLPSLAAPPSFPPKLIQLSDSLLAQSRQRASHLKPEEEIARTYACCDIACTRLRASLRLPAVKSGGAPCKPAVYKKLTNFLERILSEDGGSGALPRTPGKESTGKKRGLDGEIKNSARRQQQQQQQEDEGTPSKSSRYKDVGFVGNIKNTNSTQTGRGDRLAPDFVMPSIRKLCRTLGTPLLAPHVYTGTCVALKLAELWPPKESEDDKEAKTALKSDTVSLVIALYLMVLTKMKKGKMTTKVFKLVSQKAVETLQDTDDGYTIGNIQDWIRRVNREEYCAGQDWWESVPDAVFSFDPDGTGGQDDSDERAAHEDAFEAGDNDDESYIRSDNKKLSLHLEAGEEDPEGVLLPGLGTMMDDNLDWTSEERKLDFLRWKANIIKKMDMLDNPTRSRKAVSTR